MKNRRLIAFVMIAGATAVGCQEDELVDEPFGVVDLALYYRDGSTATNPAAGLPRLEPLRGFSQGERVELYDFGLVPFERRGTNPSVAPVAPMYFFFDRQGNPLFAAPERDERTGLWSLPGGNPTLGPNQAANADRSLPFPLRARQVIVDPRRRSAAHQRPIVDLGPEALANQYTGLWEVIEVTADDGYTPDSVKSWKTLSAGLASGALEARATGRVINCPLVDERSAIAPSVAAVEAPSPVVELWYRRKRAACLLANGWETLLRDGRLLRANEDAARIQTLDVMRLEVTVDGKTQARLVAPIGRAYVPTVVTSYPEAGAAEARFANDTVIDERPRRTEADPPGYSPIRWYWDVVFPGAPTDASPTGYTPGSLRSMDGVPDAMKRQRAGGPWVRNLATIGTRLACGTKDAAGTCSQPDACDQLGLECNAATCLCDVPSVGYGAACAPGFQRCRTSLLTDAEKAFAPAGYLCHPRQPRGFCLPRCDASAANATKEKGPGGEDLDSRCGNVPGMVCLTPGASSSMLDDRKESVCVRRCTPAAGEAAMTSCRMPLPMSLPDRDGVDQETDVAAGWRCLNQRNVSACGFDFAYEPR